MSIPGLLQPKIKQNQCGMWKGSWEHPRVRDLEGLWLLLQSPLDVPRALSSLLLLSLAAVWPLLSAQPCQSCTLSQEEQHKPSPELPPCPRPGLNPQTQPQTQPLPHGFCIFVFFFFFLHNSLPELWGVIPPPCHEVTLSQSCHEFG